MHQLSGFLGRFFYKKRPYTSFCTNPHFNSLVYLYYFSFSTNIMHQYVHHMWSVVSMVGVLKKNPQIYYFLLPNPHHGTICAHRPPPPSALARSPHTALPTLPYAPVCSCSPHIPCSALRARPLSLLPIYPHPHPPTNVPLQPCFTSSVSNPRAQEA